MKKVIFCDIDGTLVNSKKEITKITSETLKKLKAIGIPFVLASGRPRTAIIDVAKAANASNIIIASNGTDIYDFENDIQIYKNNIKFKKVKRVYDLCKNIDCSVLFESGFNAYSNVTIARNNPKVVSSMNQLKNVANNEGINQIVITSTNFDIIKTIKSKILKMGFGIGNQSKSLSYANLNSDEKYYYIDVINRNCNKGVAVKKLARCLRIKKSSIITIGDDNNDLKMFEHSGLKVAVENAIDVLKDHADKVILSNDMNGVAKFITEYFDLQ